MTELRVESRFMSVDVVAQYQRRISDAEKMGLRASKDDESGAQRATRQET